jgi:hypothetical protein
MARRERKLIFKSNSAFRDHLIRRCPSANVQSFGRRQANESRRCPNPRAASVAYGDFDFGQFGALIEAVEMQTDLKADRLFLRRRSGRLKSECPTLAIASLLLRRCGTDRSVPRSVVAVRWIGDEQCRIMTLVVRMGLQRAAERAADIDVR